MRRWDFQSTKEIFNPPQYIVTILNDLEEAQIIKEEFLSILGPDLKAVTGSSDQIDMETEKVNDQVRKLESFSRDVFSEKHSQLWRSTFENFKSQITQID